MARSNKRAYSWLLGKAIRSVPCRGDCWLGICFLRRALEGAIEGIGEGCYNACMKSNPARLLRALVWSALLLPPVAYADDDKPSGGHEAFIKGLNEMKSSELVSGVEAQSASKPRSLSPVVSRFKGWFIDVTEKTKLSKLDGVSAVEGVSLASKAADSSYWQFVETEMGYLVVATGGNYKGWVVGRDDSAKMRPEGPTLTVAPALRLLKTPTANSYWDLTLTEKGLVLKAKSGKYKGWFWDFGGGDPSHKEGEREVAINVLLAERVVAGSYFAVNAK